MPDTYSPYEFIAVLTVMAIGFCLAPLGLAWLWAKKFAPAKPGLSKNATYECGLESKGDAWSQFKSEYYIYALLFLVFDIESVFLLPFAVVFTRLSAGACAAMAIFLLLLIEGLVWAWHRGALTWDAHDDRRGRQKTSASLH